MTQQTVSKHLRKIGSYGLGRLQSQQDHPITRTVLQQQCSMKQKHTKYTQINAKKIYAQWNGPVWQNPIKRTKNCLSECAYDCTAPV